LIQKQISTDNANDGQLKQLYETAFPKEELIPWDDLEMTIMMMGPGTFSLHDWDEIVGELRKYWTWDKNKD
jgi:hypothetical protein